MGIGATYRSKAAQAVLGPAHSSLIPSVLWIGLLDGTGTLIAMSGTSVTHDQFQAATDGVENAVTIDGGAAGVGWEIHQVALYDAATGGAIVLSADLPAPAAPLEGDPLAFAAGGLTFTVA